MKLLQILFALIILATNTVFAPRFPCCSCRADSRGYVASDDEDSDDTPDANSDEEDSETEETGHTAKTAAAARIDEVTVHGAGTGAGGANDGDVSEEEDYRTSSPRMEYDYRIEDARRAAEDAALREKRTTPVGIEKISTETWARTLSEKIILWQGQCFERTARITALQGSKLPISPHIFYRNDDITSADIILVDSDHAKLLCGLYERDCRAEFIQNLQGKIIVFLECETEHVDRLTQKEYTSSGDLQLKKYVVIKIPKGTWVPEHSRTFLSSCHRYYPKLDMHIPTDYALFCPVHKSFDGEIINGRIIVNFLQTDLFDQESILQIVSRGIKNLWYNDSTEPRLTVF